ncbi:MAG: hypothetical protein WCD76_10500 [Pyrinomonadaceae bacterium]
MSRLAFAPRLKEVAVTDIKAGVAIFAPKPEQTVSFAALKNALKRAGYTLGSAEITVVGTMNRGDSGLSVVADASGQIFYLEGSAAGEKLKSAGPGTRVEVVGDWKTVGEGDAAREIITPESIRTTEAKPQTTSSTPKARRAYALFRGSLFIAGVDANERADERAVRFVNVINASPVPARRARTGGALMTESTGEKQTPSLQRHARLDSPAGALAVAPIRTTSPGLTVFQGGAITTRFSSTRQRLGGLRVTRQSLNVSASYTPTPHLQLEAEVPFTRTTFDDGASRGEGAGFGNVTLWGKYRFYRRVEKWGDRQASARFGLELLTGKKSGPDERELNAPVFVRQQLTPISGGLSAHADASYSQARGRLIFGGNAAGVLRSERAGYRTGHELQVNTDLEYVVFPFNYRKPTGEVFAILETNFVRRWEGRADGAAVAQSRSTEYYVAPGLQYVATSRVVVEGSIQLPILQRTGAQLLRTRSNVLVGLRYLF